MRFEWDPEKARTNLIKHRVDFESARFVFDDPLAILVPDRIIDGEERWHIIGRTPDHRLYLVVHTIREDRHDTTIRIISARKADPRERRAYELGE
ncbi:MAG: BrnT family toxin [Thermomicrobiales bacterium]